MTLPDQPDVIAPDGSGVRILCRLSGGSMAHFTLPAGQVSKAVRHRTVEELWFFMQGRGRMWRARESSAGTPEEITDVHPGISVSIPAGTTFQFRNDAPGVLWCSPAFS